MVRQPVADRVDGKSRRIVIDTDTHPALVIGNIVDALEPRAAQGPFR
jgi:hypothetical protein